MLLIWVLKGCSRNLAAGCKKQGLKFGVSEHLGASFTWFQAAHGSDKEGAKAGVPYDGSNLDYQDLYHAQAASDDKDWLTNNPAFQAGMVQEH